MSGKKGRVMSPVVPGVPDGVAAHNPQQRRPRMGRHEDMVRQQLHDLAHEGGGGGDINRNKRDTIKTGACKKVCSDPGWKLSFPHSCRNGLEGRKLCMQQLQRP